MASRYTLTGATVPSLSILEIGFFYMQDFHTLGREQQVCFRSHQPQRSFLELAPVKYGGGVRVDVDVAVVCGRTCEMVVGDGTKGDGS